MKNDTVTALKESLEIWVDRLQGKDRKNDCPLCKIYRKDENWEQNCYGCPIYEKTGRHNCFGTTYYEDNDEKCNLGMVKLLASLLPDSEPETKYFKEDHWIWDWIEKKYTQEDLKNEFARGKSVGKVFREEAFKVKQSELDYEFALGKKEGKKAKQDELEVAYANGKEEGRKNACKNEQTILDNAYNRGKDEGIKVRQDELNTVYYDGKKVRQDELNTVYYDGKIEGKRVVAIEIGRLSDIILSKYGGKF